MDSTAYTRSQILKTHARRLGFTDIGISKAAYMEEEARRLEEWLNQGHQGKMSYLENHFEKRVNPTKLVPDAKSVVTLVYNYFTPQLQEDETAPKISKYAYGKDYHYVIKHKLKTLLQIINEEIGEVSGRCFVDSAPVLERDWAKRSGLGWIGKNTMLIRPQQGSYFFLAELIIDLELAPDSPIKDFCGTCTRCIDACPTDAISPKGYLMDGSKCISYFTIELRDEIPADYKGKFENWMFGCDICQQVCPWNRFSQAHEEPLFEPHPDLLAMTNQDWQEITKEVFQDLFRKSPVKRTGYEGLKKNIRFLHRDS